MYHLSSIVFSGTAVNLALPTGGIKSVKARRPRRVFCIGYAGASGFFCGIVPSIAPPMMSVPPTASQKLMGSPKNASAQMTADSGSRWPRTATVCARSPSNDEKYR